MKKNIFEWIIFIILFVWQILQNLVGAGMWLWFKLKGDVRPIVKNKYSTVYASKYMSGGISLGYFAFVDSYYENKAEVVAHEQGHMWDSKLFGPFYLFIIGIPSLLNAAFNFTECYYSFFCEAWANRHAGLVVDDRCRLHFKDEAAKKVQPHV